MFDPSIINPLFSIIIPALNEESYINQCLESIKKLDAKNHNLEIIVVDNGSSDNTVEICESYGVKVLIKREGTIGSLRNHGARFSKGHLLAFLDADCVVPNNWLSKALQYFHREDRIVLGFKLSVPEHSNFIAKSWDLLFTKRYSIREVEWIPSGNMIVPRQEFMSIGGFNEALETNEDYDFCFRIRNRGYKIVSCSDTSVIHLRPPQSLRQIFQKELWHGKEVFKVFVDDICRNKNINIFKRKNFKVILYAFCYLIFILFLLFSLILVVTNKMFLPLLVLPFIPIFISFFMALRYTISIKKYNLILGLTILLTIYGFSRAISLLPYNKIRKWIPNL